MTPTALILLNLFGCDAFRKAFSSVSGLTDSTVVQGAVLAVEIPEDDTIAALLEGTDFAPGTAVTVFVADAKSVTDLANAPVDGAVVTVEGNVSEAVPGQGGGLYANDPSTSGLVYTDGANWMIDLDLDGSVGTVSLALPPAADFEIPAQHDKGTPLVIDLTGQGFHSSVGVVIDQTGQVVWTNAPTSISDLYESMSSNEAGVITIPGSAFASDGIYAVGLAAMVHTESEDVTDINTALSKVRVGKMRLFPVSTIALP